MNDAGPHEAYSRSRIDTVRVRVLQGTVLAVALSWSLDVVSFLDVKEAALWIGVLVLAACDVAARRDPGPGFRAFSPCWIVLCSTLAMGLAWAPVAPLVLNEGLRIAPLLLVGSLSFDLLQHPLYRVAVVQAVCVAAIGAAILALFQRSGMVPGLFPAFPHYDQAMYSAFGNEGLLAGFLAVGLVLLPGAALPGLSPGRSTWALTRTAMVAILLGVTLLLTASRGGQLAVLAGLTALLVSRAVSLRAGGVLFTLMIAVMVWGGALGAPFTDKWQSLFGAGDVGGNVRRWILGASLSLAGEHPLAGCGLGHYAREIPLWLGRQAQISERGVNTLITSHAHLDMLEWIGETGWLGGLGAVWVLSRLRLRFPVALCGLCALLVFSLTHPAFHSAPHALAGVIFYAMNLPPAAPRSAVGSRRAVARASAVLLMALIGGATFFATVFHPSLLLRRAEDAHLAGGDAGAAYERASGAWGYHPEAYESYAIFALERGDPALAEHHLRRALPGLETGRVYQLLAVATEAQGRVDEACHWYVECLKRWPWVTSIRARYNALCGAGASSR